MQMPLGLQWSRCLTRQRMSDTQEFDGGTWGRVSYWEVGCLSSCQGETAAVGCQPDDERSQVVTLKEPKFAGGGHSGGLRLILRFGLVRGLFRLSVPHS